MKASEGGHLEVVQALLAAGADKDATDLVGGGVCMKGAGCMTWVHVREPRTMTMLNCWRLECSIAKRLLSGPASRATMEWCRPCWMRVPTRRPRKEWWVPGVLAENQEEFIMCVREMWMMLLLASCAQKGYTALGMASINGHLAVVQALLAAGASKDAKDIFVGGGFQGNSVGGGHMMGPSRA